MPVAGLSAHAETGTAEPPAEESPSPQLTEKNKVTMLLLDIEELIDRGLYPRVIRSNGKGAPTVQEINEVERTLKSVHQSYQNSLSARISAIADPEAENDLIFEINTYFSAAQKFEGLKIILGRPISHEQWEANYSLAAVLDPLAQLNFVTIAAMLSQNYVSLPGTPIPTGQIETALKTQGTGCRTGLQYINGKWQLLFQLNPAFVNTFEELALVTSPNTRNVLLYSLHFASLTVYENWADTHMVRGEPLSTLPEPPRELRDQFPSLRLIRAEMLTKEHQNFQAKQKPDLLKAILDAMDRADKSNAGWVLDEEFATSLLTMMGHPPDATTLPTQLAELRKSEKNNFPVAVVALLNLLDTANQQVPLEFLLFEAKRLALRFAILANPDPQLAALNIEDREKLAHMIDTKTKAVVANLLQDGVLFKAVTTIQSRVTPSQQVAIHRLELQNKLVAVANNMKNFATSSINLQYLMDAENSGIMSLNGSDLIQAFIQALRQQGSYARAFNFYEEQVFNFAQAFNFSPALSTPVTLEQIFRQAKTATWNPARLADVMSPTDLSNLSTRSAIIKKDFQDLVRIGQLLRFDVYEQVHRNAFPPTNSPPTPVSLQVGQSRLGQILGPSLVSYYEAMRTDVLTNAPILGAEVTDSNQGLLASWLPSFITRSPPPSLLYEKLSDPNLNQAQKITMVDDQLAKVEQTIAADCTTLNGQLQKLNTHEGDDLSGLGRELATLITHATQIEIGLNAFAGFDTYYGEIRRNLLLPDLATMEWRNFSSWSSSVSTYALLFMAANLVAKKTVFGEAARTVSKFLAPVFGTDLKWFNRIVFGVIGANLAGQVYTTFGTERWRRNTLQDFFVGGVALFQDVDDQQAVYDSARAKLGITAVVALALVGGFKLAFRAAKGTSEFLIRNRTQQLMKNLDVLGLDEKASLSELDLVRATNEASAKAERMKDTLNPSAIALMQAYIRQARLHLEAVIADDTVVWKNLDKQFSSATARLGLVGRNNHWTNPDALGRAVTQLEKRWGSGSISTAEYLELKQSLASMFQLVQPVRETMKTNPFMSNYMTRVWNNLWLDSTLPTDMADINATQAFYKSRNATEFVELTDNFFSESSQPVFSNGQFQTVTGRTQISSRADKLAENLAKALKGDPEAAQSKIEALLNGFRKAEAK